MKTLKQLENEVINISENADQLDEKAPPGSAAMEFLKKSAPNFKKRYGSDWEKALYATAWKKFGKNEEVDENTDIDLTALTEEDKKEISSYVMTVRKQRRDWQSDREKRAREVERAKDLDQEKKEIERKHDSRERIAKIRQRAAAVRKKTQEETDATANTALTEDLSSLLDNNKFDMLLRHGLIKFGDIPYLKLALRKLDENQVPTATERNVMSNVFERLVTFITSDPILTARVDQKILATKNKTA